MTSSLNSQEHTSRFLQYQKRKYSWSLTCIFKLCCHPFSNVDFWNMNMNCFFIHCWLIDLNIVLNLVGVWCGKLMHGGHRRAICTSSNQAPYTIATLNSWNLETALRYINFHSGYVNSSSKTVPLACETETYTSADSTDFASLYSSLPNFQVSASIWYKQFTSCPCDLVTVQEEYPGYMLPPFCSSYMLSDMGIQKTQENLDTECFILFCIF